MAITKKPVIVMALYDIGRDNWDSFDLSYNTYLGWMKNTLSLVADFVIYTEDKFVDKIKEYRSEFDPEFQRTELIVKPLEELEYYVEYNVKLRNLMSSKEFKDKVHLDVPEAVQPLYNIIMFNKLSFLKDAKDNGYFGGDYFIWADAGGLRNDISEYRGQSWPDLKKIEEYGNKIVFFSHSADFNIDDYEFHSLSQIRHIQGTSFFVPIEKLDKFVKTFKETVDECLNSGFIGSDEKVLDITYLKCKEDYQLIHCTWREYFQIFQSGYDTIKKKVFLDLGTHSCQRLISFISSKLPIDDKWEIHTFEPNPLLHPATCVDQFKGFDITVHDKAVWVSEGLSVFKRYGENGTGQGSLLAETKGDREYHDYHSSVEVKTIDFFEFIKQFKDYQDIYIKMDIEWSEYAVIEDLLVRGWPKNIKHIWIEWHGIHQQFFKNKSKFLTEQIKLSECEVTSWQ
tara:strand:+ start:1501 stop:2865 length:1365 start_codon:yes stop_codon:yes gene_type:complete